MKYRCPMLICAFVFDFTGFKEQDQGDLVIDHFKIDHFDVFSSRLEKRFPIFCHENAAFINSFRKTTDKPAEEIHQVRAGVYIFHLKKRAICWLEKIYMIICLEKSRIYGGREEIFTVPRGKNIIFRNRGWDKNNIFWKNIHQVQPRNLAVLRIRFIRIWIRILASVS